MKGSGWTVWRHTWFEHVQRDAGYIGRRTLKMELQGKRKRRRQKRMFMDRVREDMQVVGVTEEDAPLMGVIRRRRRKKRLTV